MSDLRLLTVKEFAAIVRKDPQTIYRRIWRGVQGGVIRDGGSILIDQAKAICCTSDAAHSPNA